MADFQDVVNAIKGQREISDKNQKEADEKKAAAEQSRIDKLKKSVEQISVNINKDDGKKKKNARKALEEKKKEITLLETAQADSKARKVTESAALLELKDSKAALSIMNDQIVAQGGVALENAEYNKLDLAVKQQEFDLRIKNASNKGAKEEIEKERRAAISKQGTLLQKISSGIMGIGASMKESAKAALASAGKGIMSILKGTLFAGLFVAVAMFLQSPLFGKMVDFITKTLIPKLKSFYDAFFGPQGGFFNGIKTLFSDDSGIGSIVLGITGVVAALAVFKVAKMFSKIKGGISSLGGFLKSVGGKLFGLKTPKGGLPGSKGGIPGVPAKAQGITKTAGSFAKMGASAGKGIGTFISGILKGIASGLSALANPATLVGLAAVSAAIIAISAALRIAAPAFEPIGKMMESFGATIKLVFQGIGDFVESTGKSIRSIIEGIGTAIGNVIDKITSMSTAGTEATTKQIKELSKIPSDRLFSAAQGIDAMKAALDGFGGGTFTKIADSLFGGNGPIDKIIDLAKDVPALMKAAEAINLIAAVGGNYEMAQAEQERRKRIVQLEKDLASGDVEGFDTKANIAKAKAELDSLKKQGISGNQGSGLVNTSTTARIANESKANQINASGSGGAGGGTTVVNAPTVKSSTNTSNSTTSSTSFVGNQDPIFAAAANSF